MARMRRTTVYFKPKIYRALKIRTAATDSAVSDFVNDAVQEALREEAIDREAFRKTRKQRSVPLSQVVSGLKRDGLL